MIENGWAAAGITDAIRLGLKQLSNLDLFDDIDPIIDDDCQLNVCTNINAVATSLPSKSKAIANVMRMRMITKMKMMHGYYQKKNDLLLVFLRILMTKKICNAFFFNLVT